MGILRGWISAYIEANNAQDTGSIDDLNQRIQHVRSVFHACTGDPGLVPDGIDALIHAIAMAHRPDLFDGVSLVKVNGDGTDSLHLAKALRYLVHAIDFRGTAQHSAIRGHPSHRSAAKHTP